MTLPRSVFDPNQPQASMSLMNLRNSFRGLHMGDLMPLRARASMIIDPMEYATDAQAQAEWSGTGVTVAASTTKEEGNNALECAIDVTGDRTVSRTITLDLSYFLELKLWERVDVASSDFKFYLKDGDDNISYWDITSSGTPDDWQQDTLDLTTPDSDSGTPADLSDIVEFGYVGLDASKTYIFDTIKVLCGLNVAVEGGLLANFYQQVYLGTTRITFEGSSSPQITPPSANPRIDVLTLSTAGVLEWTQGVEASSPAEPTFPAGKLPICLVYCRPAMVKIVDFEDADANPTEGYIYKDVRPLLGSTVLTFLGLSDTPSSYTGQAGKAALVNAGENAMEFVDAPVINTKTEKTTLHNDDLLLIEDSQAANAKKKVKYSNTQININGLAEKTSPVDNDLFLIEDSEASNVKKKVKKVNILSATFANRQLFTSNGVFTAPTGVTMVWVTMIGGGGGGGGCYYAGAAGYGGGGGGGGEAVTKLCIPVVAGNNYNITVGAKGIGGAGAGGGAGTAGTAGGYSQFHSSAYRVSGGGGGMASAPGTGGAGGAANSIAGSTPGAGGDFFSFAGGAGGNTSGVYGGGGGGSLHGKGGAGNTTYVNPPDGADGTGYGSGGGGGGMSGPSGSWLGTGGDGTDGFVLVEW